MGRVYIFAPQIADAPPLNPLRRSFESDAEAIQEAKKLLTTIAGLTGVSGGSVGIGEHPVDDELHWLGTWRWSPVGLWSWEEDFSQA